MVFLQFSIWMTRAGSGARVARLKRPWRDGRTELVLPPVAFLRRLCGISADGEHVIVEGPTQVMSVLDRSGKVVATFKAELGTVLLAGDELVYALDVGKSWIAHLAVGDATGKVRLDLPIGISPIHALAMDIAAKRIALGTEDGGVQVRSLESGEALWQASLSDRAGVVLFDGNVLRVASSNTVTGSRSTAMRSRTSRRFSCCSRSTPKPRT
jgi:hypothetical protein